MNEKKIGIFIQQLRKEKNLTQKDLAEKLNITDKAVSKWERGLNCPDISLLVPLSEILGITTSELLNSEKKSEPLNEDIAEKTVKKALVYSDKNSKSNLENLKKWTLISLSAIFLLSAVICIICDFCITGKMTWSFIVTLSLLFSWLLLLPLLKSSHNSIKNTLIVLSFLIIPYLFLLGRIIHEPFVYTLGSVISVVSIIGLWCIYLSFYKLHHRIWCAIGFVCLIVILISVCIDYSVACFLQENITNLTSNVVKNISMFLISLICFGTDYLTVHKK